MASFLHTIYLKIKLAKQKGQMHTQPQMCRGHDWDEIHTTATINSPKLPVHLTTTEMCSFWIYHVYLKARWLLSKMTPQIKHICQGKVYLSKPKTPPKNKMSGKKNILPLTAYTQYTKHVRFYLPLPISVTVSVFTVSTFIILTLTPNIPSSLLPLYKYHH